MCGIVGLINFDREAHVDPGLVDRMVSTLVHRGPDDRGTFVEGPVGLGMTRLSIIDVAGGHQPIFNEDGSKLIIFNGEIYNFPELRQELLGRGHQFRTLTDTEVILHAYEEVGPDCVNWLNGIFAFAIWDRQAQRLLVARDHLGVKPLYYFLDHHFLIFASEIKAILPHPGMTRAINPQGLRNYLAFGHSIGPETMFQGIKKLLPGHRLLWETGKDIVLEQFWDVTRGDAFVEDEVALTEEIRGLVEDSVKKQLIADVPLGAFLSGGIDSASVVALMAREKSQPIKTFSVGFQESTEFYDELADAQLTAQYLETEHQVIKVGPDDLVEVLPQLVYYYDEPFADAAAFPTYMVARLARQDVKVVLTGDGADELFGGYLRYGVDANLAWTLRLPAGLLRGLAQLALPWVKNNPRWQRGLQALQENDAASRAASWYVWFSTDLCKEILQDGHREEVSPLDYLGVYRRYYRMAPTSDSLNRMMYADLKTQMVDSYLEKVDKATMAVGLEARVPYLDYRLVELAFKIPSSFKVNGRKSKMILRKAFTGMIPPATAAKPKHGFAVPLDLWMRGDLREFVADILMDRRTRERGIFNPRTIAAYFDDHIRHRACLSTHLYFLVVFELWCRTFLDNNP